jgi:DNA-binding response OmpR family regulator
MTLYKILLVHKNKDPSWTTVVKEAVADIAEITAVKPMAVPREIRSKRYDLILIHAASTPDVSRLVRETRKQDVAPIVVVAASPSAEAARGVFRAGASDYVLQSVNEKELRAYLLETLGRNRKNSRGEHGHPNDPPR